MIRILLADDHTVLRAGLRVLLGAEPEFEIVGEAADGKTALDEAKRLRPDVAVLDVGLPDMSGIELARLVKHESPTTAIVMLTMFEDDALLRTAMQAGASGYIVKRAAEAELVDAIKSVARGDMYIHPAMIRGFVRGVLTLGSQGGRDIEPPEREAPTLTPREGEILGLLAQGYTNRQVAEQLHLSTRTVETHRLNLTTKINANSRADLVRYARDHRML